MTGILPNASITFWIVGWPCLLIGAVSYTRMLVDLLLVTLHHKIDAKQHDGALPTPMLGLALVTLGVWMSGYPMPWLWLGVLAAVEAGAWWIVYRLTGRTWPEQKPAAD